MKLTDRKAHVLAYLVQELPLKWQGLCGTSGRGSCQAQHGSCIH